MTLQNLFRAIPRPKVRDTEAERFERRCTRLTRRLNDIRAAFDMVQDDDTIDALIYEENAVLCRLAALYKEARAAGITLEMYERHR